MDYALYLKSPHWRRIKKAYRESGRPQKCSVCGDKRYQLHHLTYERIGGESLDDLTPLCQNCHSAIHYVAGEHGSLNPFEHFDPERAEENRRANPVVARYHEQQVRKAAMAEGERKAAARRKREIAERRQAVATDTRARELSKMLGL